MNKIVALLAILAALLLASGYGQQRAGSDAVIVLNDDGAWCWFQDERAIIVGGKLIFGSVASGRKDSLRKGDIDAAWYDIQARHQTGARPRPRPAGAFAPVVPSARFELHDALLSRRGAYDDHNAPAFLVRPDGRLLAVYAKHGDENRFYYRISENPGDPGSWRAERSFTPSEKSRITYSNLFRLSSENRGKGRIYNFYRGLDDSFKPSYAWSDDHGETWVSGNVVIDVPARVRHRPYVKYASNGVDTIHLFYTDGHPRNFDNSAWHAFYRGGKLHRSDGTPIRALAEGLREPGEGTLVFAGDANNVAWVSDIHLDRRGRPYVAYAVQKNSGGLPDREHGQDHRYRYARWTGHEWTDHEIAFAGSRLYPGEDDYTGNIALDPNDPDGVFISTNADPRSGKPLVSAADDRRHYEIFEGRTRDGGTTWNWTAVTQDSTADNLRPIVPAWDGQNLALLWMRGK